MLSTILHWTCDPTSASMASLLFRWACLGDAPLWSAETFPSGKRSEFPGKSYSFLRRSGITQQPSLKLSFRCFSWPVSSRDWQSFRAIVSFTIATKVTIGKDLTSPALPYLFGLIAIFIVGSGLYSVDYWLLYILAGH